MASGRITFLWPELPAYAARCIRAVQDQRPGDVAVVATTPTVPIKGMDAILGDCLTWIKGDEANLTWEALGLTVPQLLFSGSYKFPGFRALAQQVRDAGGAVIMMADNNWTGSLRQKVLDPLHHRLFRRKEVSGVFVPGASGVTWATQMGYDPRRVFQGLYGADPALFQDGPPLQDRPKTFQFVGQFVDRKNVMRLTQAFASVASDLEGWQLRLCGSGPLRDAMPQHPQIVVEDFVQPDRLSGLMREARCLVLPSLKEHWGLVVHEAALSGCALALSDGIGAGDDLATDQNAVRFPAHDTAAIAAGLRQIAGWDAGQWQAAQAASARRAQAFGPARFASGVDEIWRDLQGADP